MCDSKCVMMDRDRHRGTYRGKIICSNLVTSNTANAVPAGFHVIMGGSRDGSVPFFGLQHSNISCNFHGKGHKTPPRAMAIDSIVGEVPSRPKSLSLAWSQKGLSVFLPFGFKSDFGFFDGGEMHELSDSAAERSKLGLLFLRAFLFLRFVVVMLRVFLVVLRHSWSTTWCGSSLDEFSLTSTPGRSKWDAIFRVGLDLQYNVCNANDDILKLTYVRYFWNPAIRIRESACYRNTTGNCVNLLSMSTISTLMRLFTWIRFTVLTLEKVFCGVRGFCVCIFLPTECIVSQPFLISNCQCCSRGSSSGKISSNWSVRKGHLLMRRLVQILWVWINYYCRRNTKYEKPFFDFKHTSRPLVAYSLVFPTAIQRSSSYYMVESFSVVAIHNCPTSKPEYDLKVYCI